jgi:protein involved in polysaccharide export with SLBB domain
MARVPSWLALATLLLTSTVSRAQTVAPAGVAVSPDALRPGDAIHLRFFGDSAVSGDFRVDKHGDVTLPLLGVRSAANQDPDALLKDITSEFARTYRYAPEVTLLRRITVLGAVTKPGLYLADATMGINELLALAGGPLPQGRPDEVKIIRDGQTFTARTIVGGASGASIRSGDQVFVPERSWVSRNMPVLLGGLSGLVALLSLAVR